jgi:hypothetical protein
MVASGLMDGALRAHDPRREAALRHLKLEWELIERFHANKILHEVGVPGYRMNYQELRRYIFQSEENKMRVKCMWSDSYVNFLSKNETLPDREEFLRRDISKLILGDMNTSDTSSVTNGSSRSSSTPGLMLPIPSERTNMDNTVTEVFANNTLAQTSASASDGVTDGASTHADVQSIPEGKKDAVDPEGNNAVDPEGNNAVSLLSLFDQDLEVHGKEGTRVCFIAGILSTEIYVQTIGYYYFVGYYLYRILIFMQC